jgi:hypothetical protein
MSFWCVVVWYEQVPEAVIGLDSSDVCDFSTKLNKKFCFAVVKVGRTHFFQTSSQSELTDFIHACHTSINVFITRPDFDFQLNRIHKPSASASADSKSEPASKSAASASPPPSPSTKPATAKAAPPVPAKPSTS